LSAVTINHHDFTVHNESAMYYSKNTKSQRKEERGQLTASEKIENYANISAKTSA